MQIVIDIPEEVYKDAKEHMNCTWKSIIAIHNALNNGTVLSKGHWIQQPRYEGDDQPDLVCPDCGFKISWWDMGNFCAKCGKELEGGAG